jgi:hypothetical protein
MKSIKKRFKLLLAEIEQLASELGLLCADLSLLSEMQQTADKILRACEDLSSQVSELKKAAFRDGIAEAEALAELEEMVDSDAISGLEDRFFAELGNHADSGAGEFLQQLLEKIDKRYTKMIERIQQLSALLDEDGE